MSVVINLFSLLILHFNSHFNKSAIPSADQPIFGGRPNLLFLSSTAVDT